MNTQRGKKKMPVQSDTELDRAAKVMRIRKEHGVGVMEAMNIVDGKRDVSWDGVKNFEKEALEMVEDKKTVGKTEADGHADRAHSKVVGGSSAGRGINCPGSVELSTLFPDNETSSYTEEGTALHEAVELILDRDLEGPEVIGPTFNGYEITKDLYNDAVRPALEMLDDYEAEVGEISFALEARVAFPEIEGAFGTVDLTIAAADRGVIWDWKFGAGVAVDAENNAQMLFYAHGARSDPKLAHMFPRDKPIEIIIAQPRMENGFKRWMTDHEQVDIFVKELVKAVEIARDPLVVDFAQQIPVVLKKLYSGDEEAKKYALHAIRLGLQALDDQFQQPVFKTGSHCRWCKAKKGCPIINLDANQALSTSQADLEEDIGEWLRVANELKTWIKDIEQWAYRRLQDGYPVEGHKLVAKNAVRKWVDELEAFTHFSSMRSVKADEFAPRKMLSVPQMEKLLSRKGKEIPAVFVMKESSGLKMVPESAKGEPVSLTPTMLEGATDYLKK